MTSKKYFFMYHPKWRYPPPPQKNEKGVLRMDQLYDSNLALSLTFYQKRHNDHKLNCGSG